PRDVGQRLARADAGRRLRRVGGRHRCPPRAAGPRRTGPGAARHRAALLRDRVMETGLVNAAAPPLVSMRGLTKSFAGVRALDAASFELHAGEVHALMGENGAGKSTLMKVLGGIHAREAGAIEVNGQAVAIDTPREALALGIAIVHQELNLMS